MSKLLDYLRPRIPDYSIPTCTCGALLRKVTQRVLFKGIRSAYDYGRCDHYWHCDECQADWVLVTPKRIKLHLSKHCKKNEHGSCMNRNFDESSCSCKCHKKD